ncbi:DUF3087 family protein [Halomonas sp. PAMB 3264]|uniref:DUF3087 family protein n=1 Tax=Halomonas sp. PAMB 3264 TaxID=3075222 RepID=UPI002899F8EF|nr:DUF3087 family protein [Halomonas sp. PAMB 3264]WNL42834.1 DUF3087 family protein [Halomonas sp. PAMB 3264]
MAFTLQAQDPNRYRRKARMISVMMVGQLIIFSMLFSLLLSSVMESSLWAHGLGIALGLLATSALFAGLKERPWMGEISYVWQLKNHLSRIQGYQASLERAVDEDNRAALDVLSFYHEGVDQVAALNGKAPDPARVAQKERVLERRQALALPDRVTVFDPHDLSAFTRR